MTRPSTTVPIVNSLISTCCGTNGLYSPDPVPAGLSRVTSMAPSLGGGSIGTLRPSRQRIRGERSRDTLILCSMRMTIAIGSAVLAGSAAWAQADDAARELLRERVESIRVGMPPEIRGAPIAATHALPELYERRRFALAWTPEKAEQLTGAIRDAEADGLDPADYHLEAIERLRRDAAGSVDLDLVLTDALVRLGYHVLFGKVDPEELDPDWNFAREIPGFDPAAELQRVIDSPDLRKAVDDAKQQHALYAGLKSALARYRAIAKSGGWGEVPPGPTLRAGEAGPRVKALRARLTASDDLSSAPASDAYDDELAAAVGRFQARHGLTPDGAAGARTVAEMNVPVEARIAQLRVNLERARWLLHDIGDAFVAVNIAGFELYYIREGKIAWNTRVQVGKPFRAARLPVEHHLPRLQPHVDRSSGDPRERHPAGPEARPLDARQEGARGPRHEGEPRCGRRHRLGPRERLALSLHAAPGARPEQRARAREVHVPQRARGVPARHAQQEPVRQ